MRGTLDRIEMQLYSPICCCFCSSAVLWHWGHTYQLPSACAFACVVFSKCLCRLCKWCGRWFQFSWVQSIAIIIIIDFCCWTNWTLNTELPNCQVQCVCVCVCFRGYGVLMCVCCLSFAVFSTEETGEPSPWRQQQPSASVCFLFPSIGIVWHSLSFSLQSAPITFACVWNSGGNITKHLHILLLFPPLSFSSSPSFWPFALFVSFSSSASLPISISSSSGVIGTGHSSLAVAVAATAAHAPMPLHCLNLISVLTM